MRISVFTLRYCEEKRVIDTAPLDEHLRGRELVDMRDHFFLLHGVPHLLCIVKTLDTSGEGRAGDENDAAQADPARRDAGDRARRPGRQPGLGDRRRSDPPPDLGQSEVALFESIRAWRHERAKKGGLPHYAILLNDQVAEIARRRPGSKTALGRIRGLGQAKIDRYGDDLLRLIGGAGGADGGATADGAARPENGAAAPAASVTVAGVP